MARKLATAYNIDEPREEMGTPEDPVKMPAFNFYRDTLNYNPEVDNSEVKTQQADGDEAAPSVGVKKPIGHCVDDRGSVAPQDQDSDDNIKNALSLHRTGSRSRKLSRWSEGEGLGESDYLEMAETKRANGAKKQKVLHEKAVEKSNPKRKPEDDDEEQQSQWRLSKTIYSKPILEYPVTSHEKGTQEERERNILGLFLPPGSKFLPVTPNEPDPPTRIDRWEPKFIPVEDGNTKVCDFRTHSWPPPRSLLPNPESSLSMATDSNKMPLGIENTPQSSSLNPFLPEAPYYNPWSRWSTTNYSAVPPPSSLKITDMSPFQQFPPRGLKISMNVLANSKPAGMTFANPNPFSFPPPSPIILHPHGPTSHGLMDSIGGNKRGGRTGAKRGGRFSDSDARRNFHGSRDRDGGGRVRGRYPNPFAFPSPIIPQANVSTLQSLMGSFGDNEREETKGANRDGKFNDSDQRKSFHDSRDRNGRGRDSGRDEDQNPFAFPSPLISQPNNGSHLQGLMGSFGSSNREGRMGANKGERFDNSDRRRNFHGSSDRGGGRGRHPNSFAFPLPLIPQASGPTLQSLMDLFRGIGAKRGGRLKGPDQRRNFHGSRDQDGGGRDRGRDRNDRDDRKGSDGEFRRQDRVSDNNDRDRNSRDYRTGSGSSGRNSRKDIFCKYFRKGNCSNGNRCKYSHDPSLNREDSKPSSRPDSYESSRSRRSPDSSNRDVDLRQSSTEMDDWDEEPSTNDVDATKFALPPSSPPPPITDHGMPFAESKVIPLKGVD